jgi:hypothetical protein
MAVQLLYWRKEGAYARLAISIYSFNYYAVAEVGECPNDLIGEAAKLLAILSALVRCTRLDLKTCAPKT